MNEVKNINNTTEEVGNMVRKAETLESLDELCLSKTTVSYLMKNFDSIDTIVICGRELAFELDTRVRKADKSPKWMMELTSALREKGFVRPATDFVMALRVERLYGAIFQDYYENFITRITKLSNEEYEKFTGINEVEIKKVKSVLRNRLTNMQYSVICLRFGLEGDDKRDRDFESIAKRFHASRLHIWQIEEKAIRRLKYCNTFPAFTDASESMNEIVNKLVDELDELHKDPVFQREKEIMAELERMKRVPFKYSDKAKVYTELYESISKLNLSTRLYNRLRRAGIDDVCDIINFPKDKWLSVRNIGRHCIEELVEKMHLAGYNDFSIDI